MRPCRRPGVLRCSMQGILLLPLLLCAAWASSSAGVGYGDSSPFDLDTTFGPGGTHLVGHVLDAFLASSADRGISGAHLALSRPGYAAIVTEADEKGYFGFFDIDQSEAEVQYDLTVMHDGYAPNSVQVTLHRGLPSYRDVSMESRTVVLVHGIRSGRDSWDEPLDGSGPYTFKSFLEYQGYRVFTPELVNSCGSIWANAGLLGSYLQEALPANGYKSYSVVAHSAGGLVTRAHMRRHAGESARIHHFITLGTPHHGSPIAKLAVKLPKWARFFGCDQGGDILFQLVPGNRALNRLNYGSDTVDGESQACAPHGPETELYGMDVAGITSIAGTHTSNWYGGYHWLGAKALQAMGCPISDGVVPIQSARFRASPNFYADSDLAVDCEVEHLTSGVQNFTSSRCIAQAVVRILHGYPPSLPPAAPDDRQPGGDEAPRAWLPIIDGVIMPGGVFADSVYINALSELSFFCLWSGDSLGLSLASPSGIVITPEYADTSASVIYTASAEGAVYELRYPESGVWKLFVASGADAVPDTLLLMTSLDTALSLDVEVTSSIAPTGAFLCAATLLAGGSPLPGAAVIGDVLQADGTSLEFSLLDDGTAPDAIAGDGIFTAELPANGQEGSFAFSFTGIAEPGNPQTEMRQAYAAGMAAILPDLVIEPEGFVIGDAAENNGIVGYLDEIPITLSCQNLSAAVVDSVRLLVQNLRYGAATMDTVLAFAPGAAVQLQTTWLAADHDTTWIMASAVVLGNLPDAEYVNNSVMQMVRPLIPGEPTSLPGVGDEDDEAGGGDLALGGSRVVLFQNYPNPFNPTTSILFAVPANDTWVDVAIYDIAGRRVRELLAASVEKGTHRLEWQGDDDRGQRLPSGIYFCRLRIGEEVVTRKIAMVK